MQAAIPSVDEWLNRFFAAYYERRPVNATFIGVSDQDDRLPDLSADGAADTVAEMRDLLRGARELPVDALDGPGRLDVELASGFLETQISEFESEHFHRGNPSFHVGEAVFAVLSLFLNAPGPLDERLASAAARMRGIPAMLEVARGCVASAPAEWTERAIRECDGALAFFREGFPHLASGSRTGEAALTDAALAARAFEKHRTHLQSQLAAGGREGVACGEEALDLILRRTHFFEQSADEIAERASEELAGAQADLMDGAKGLGAASPDEALAALRKLHPSTASYLGRYQQVWAEVRERCEELGLLTWPEFPIRYVPRPAWARAAAPYLYFLFYRSPRAFGRPPIHDYLVTPIEPDMPPERQTELLEATNDSVIKLNHVIHHGSVGHHVQNWHAFRAHSRVGRMAAVDCASRTAMGCAGTMAEGWACYATDLMGEAGLLTPLERYAEIRGRARMCARAIVDVRLHQGRFTLAEAAAFYVENASMSESSARAEAVKNSMFPGGAVMYLEGRDRIHALRAEMRAQWGAEYSHRRFHDTLLSYGSIPVALIAREMKRA